MSSCSAANVCVSSEETILLCWHTGTIPPWQEQKKGLAAGLKRNLDMLDNNNTSTPSTNICSSGPVWCDKNHHMRGWEAWQTVGRHAQTHSSIQTLSLLLAHCVLLSWKEAAPAPYKMLSIAQNVNLIWRIIQFTLFPQTVGGKVWHFIFYFDLIFYRVPTLTMNTSFIQICLCSSCMAIKGVIQLWALSQCLMQQLIKLMFNLNGFFLYWCTHLYSTCCFR